MPSRSLFFILVSFSAALLTACGAATSGKVTLKLENMRFDQSEVRVKAGEPVSFNLVNKDGYGHSFDLDEFDLHLPLAAKEVSQVNFTPTRPGSYVFYCASPGHEAAGMVGTLIVSP